MSRTEPPDDPDDLNPEPAPRGESTSQQASRDVSKAVGLISVMVMASRVLGFVRDAIIAAKFGSNAITSAYLYAFTLPDTLWMLVAGGAFYAAYVPVITGYFAHGKERAAWRMYSIITTLLFCVLSVIIPLAWIFARPLMLLLAPGFTDYAVVPKYGVVHPLSMAVDMTRIVLPAQYCFFLGTLMMGMLQARKQFLIPSLAPVIYNVGIILGGLLLSPWLGIAAFSWGALGGALVGNLLLQAWAIRGAGARFTPSLQLSHPGVKRAGKLVLPVILGVSLPQVAQIANGFFVSKNDVAKSILEWTNRLMQLPLGIFGQAIGIAVLPTLSQQASLNDMRAFRKTLNFGVRLSLFMTVPASVLMIVLANPMITVVYQRGAFTAADTAAATPALIFFALGVGAWSAQAVVARAFYARNDTLTPIIAGTSVALLVFLPLNALLTRFFDIPGTPALTRGPALATSIGAVVNTLTLLYFAHQRFGGVYPQRMLRSLVRILVACIPMGLIAWQLNAFIAHVMGHPDLPPHGGLASLTRLFYAAVQLLLPGAIGLLAFGVAALFLRCEEVRDILDLLIQRQRGRRA